MILGAIVEKLGGTIIDSLFGKIAGVLEAYMKKEISLEELKTQAKKALLETAKETDVAFAASIAETQKAFFSAMEKSEVMQRAWAWVVYTQLFVLTYHQIGIPLIVLLVRQFYDPRWNYPGSGATVEWAYLLLGAVLGAGAVLLRSGPGQFDPAKYLQFLRSK